MRFSVQYGQICTCMDHILNVNNSDSYSNIHTLGRYKYQLTYSKIQTIYFKVDT